MPVDIDAVFFEQGRVLITCTIEARADFGPFSVQGFGASSPEALNDANAALQLVINDPSGLFDPDEPPDGDNDLTHMPVLGEW